MSELQPDSTSFCSTVSHRPWRSVSSAGIIALVAIVFGSSLPALAAPIAYYPFETDGSGVVGPTLTLGTGATITSGGGMFGNALAVDGTATTGVASVADAAAGALDATFTNFSASFWLKPTTWNTGAANVRFITGKNGNSSNRGWYVSKLTDNKLDFAAYQSTGNSPNTYLVSTSAVALSTTNYSHIAATFSAGGTANLYVNGVNVGSIAALTTQLNGANGAPFEVGGTSTGTAKIAGNFDDYLWSSDFLTGQQIALIHGLGRFVGTSLENAGEMDAVLAAYNSFGSAVAGGKTWAYSANVGGGSIIGTSGGSVATGNAFIVLAANGSGVMLVPEPSAISLAGVALAGLGLIRKRRRK